MARLGPRPTTSRIRARPDRTSSSARQRRARPARWSSTGSFASFQKVQIDRLVVSLGDLPRRRRVEGKGTPNVQLVRSPFLPHLTRSETDHDLFPSSQFRDRVSNPQRRFLVADVHLAQRRLHDPPTHVRLGLPHVPLWARPQGPGRS